MPNSIISTDFSFGDKKGGPYNGGLNIFYLKIPLFT